MRRKMFKNEGKRLMRFVDERESERKGKCRCLRQSGGCKSEFTV